MTLEVSDAERLERMRRAFVANASHELRTPLTVLRGYLDILAEDADGDGPLTAWREPINDMRAQSARMEQIIDDMLTLARLESDTHADRDDVVDVPALIDHAVAEAEPVSNGRHRLELDVDRGLCMNGRAGEIQSAISNLVHNAVQHTPAGSRLCISWRRSSSHLAFSVADDGPGIPAADIPRLTERFYRVDVARSRVSGGTGLGLAIVKHALERHDAHLHIDSRLGVGSTFTCLFPLERSAASPR